MHHFFAEQRLDGAPLFWRQWPEALPEGNEGLDPFVREIFPGPTRCYA
jgi:hypothetical protein